MRAIHDHKIGPVNEELTITVDDAPGVGGANHLYRVTGFNAESNPSDPLKNAMMPATNRATILFQNGPIKDVGVNGITHEALMAIVADRLRSFQKGPFACKENEQALLHVEEALHWLQARTLERLRRGVEGKNIV